MQKLVIFLENVMHKILKGFEIQTDHLTPAKSQTKRKQEKKKNFSVPEGHKAKMKEHEKINKYLNLAREHKRL